MWRKTVLFLFWILVQLKKFVHYKMPCVEIFLLLNGALWSSFILHGYKIPPPSPVGNVLISRLANAKCRA